MDGKRLCTFYEASDRLGISYWTLWRGAEAGFFKTVFLGSRRMIPQSEIDHIEMFGFGKPKHRRSKKRIGEGVRHDHAMGEGRRRRGGEVSQ